MVIIKKTEVMFTMCNLQFLHGFGHWNTDYQIPFFQLKLDLLNLTMESRSIALNPYTVILSQTNCTNKLKIFFFDTVCREKLTCHEKHIIGKFPD
jgi:hypothetical protein